MLRHILTVWLLAFSAVAAAKPAGALLEITALPASVGDATADSVTSGALDAEFAAFNYREARSRGPIFWLKLEPTAGYSANGAPSLSIRKGRHLQVRVFDPRSDAGDRPTHAPRVPQQ